MLQKKSERFPTLEWFQSVAEIVNEDKGYALLGPCDAIVGVKITDLREYYVLTFRNLRVNDIRVVTEDEAQGADFWLEAPYTVWKEMIVNIQKNGKADLRHTLITIDLEAPRGFARARNPLKRESFYRFNRSFQHFFDVSSRLPTIFE